jgi:DNA mismatch repair protein MutS
MVFRSILFEDAKDRPQDSASAPDFFPDLNCDQIVDAITAGKDEYNLKPFFYSSLSSIEAITYRHTVMQDLENPSLLDRVKSFAQNMRDMRQYMAQVNKLHYKEQQEAWFLDAVDNYCESISSFSDDLSNVNLKSRGFIGFRDYLTNYVASLGFKLLWRETKQLKTDLSTVNYCMLIKGDKVTVRRYDSESDYSAEAEETFEKFAQGEVKDYRVKFRTTDDMNHIEAKILEFVAKLHPQLFSELNDYCTRNTVFLDKLIVDFDREIQFYISYIDYIAGLKHAGLQFCNPQVSDSKTNIYNREGFDIALAHKLVSEKTAVICNDFHLTDDERVLVVSGPNQGGKTTFARTFGQLHYLAKIGCPIPGQAAQLFFFDDIFTQFEKEEKVENLRGKLEDDLNRVHRIFEKATPQSIIIMNEVFTSTTLQDEIFLSTKVMEKVIALDLLCVWVTFVDELASFGPQTVSMVSTVVPENPASRTFKIVRRPADGLAYAMAIAQKHRLTYDLIKHRIKP